MGTISIEDLVVKTRVGVTEGEKSRRRKVLVSVEIERVSPPGASADSIEETVDYSKVRRVIVDFVENGRFNLIETIAEGVALALRERCEKSLAGRIAVTVKKFPYRDAKWVAYRTVL